MSFGAQKSSSSQASKPLTPEEVTDYFRQVDILTGGTAGTPAVPGTSEVPGTPAVPGTPGRLQKFATEGTPQLSPEQIQAVGGMGADRTRQIDVARKQAVDQITADPNLSIAQRQRSTQLTDQDYNDRLAAITKEIEGQKTSLAQYNAGLTADDLSLLAEIYYGGKGQTSTGRASSFGFNVGLK